MKKIGTMFISLVACSLSVVAQIIPNGDMEAWTATGTYEEPDGWGTPNPLIPGIVIVSKSTDAHGGSFAAKLEAQSIGIVTVPGVMGTGNIDPFAFTIKGGFPVSTAYSEFTGYYKFLPQGADTCWIFAIFTKWNSGSGSRDTVAMANFFAGSTPAYTQFTAPVTYLISETPDTALVVAITAKNVLLGTDGSVLYVDDMTFSGNVGIESLQQQPVNAYPNPAKDKFYIELPNSSLARQLILFDVLGKKIKTVKVESSVIMLDTGLLSDGFYFYQLEDQKAKPIATGKFSVEH